MESPPSKLDTVVADMNKPNDKQLDIISALTKYLPRKIPNHGETLKLLRG